MWNEIARAAAIAVLLAPVSAAAMTAEPFRDRPAEVAEAATLALIAARAAALAREPGTADEAMEALEADLARVPGEALAAAVESLEEAGTADEMRSAATALGEAVAGMRTAAEVPVAAATAALLLVSEVGLAEAFEEAVEGEEGAYALAFALLEEVRALLAALPADREVADLVASLGELIPGAERPATLSPDPEAAETVAQALVGALERTTGADLYLARDLGRGIDTVAGLGRDGCAADDPATARRLVAIAAFYHEDALAAPLGVFTPEEAAAAEAALDALLAAPSPTPEACDALARAFEAARARLFP